MIHNSSFWFGKTCVLSTHTHSYALQRCCKLKNKKHLQGNQNIEGICTSVPNSRFFIQLWICSWSKVLLFLIFSFFNRFQWSRGGGGDWGGVPWDSDCGHGGGADHHPGSGYLHWTTDTAGGGGLTDFCLSAALINTNIVCLIKFLSSVLLRIFPVMKNKLAWIESPGFTEESREQETWCSNSKCFRDFVFRSYL